MIHFWPFGLFSCTSVLYEVCRHHHHDDDIIFIIIHLLITFLLCIIHSKLPLFSSAQFVLVRRRSRFPTITERGDDGWRLKMRMMLLKTPLRHFSLTGLFYCIIGVSYYRIYIWSENSPHMRIGKYHHSTVICKELEEMRYNWICTLYIWYLSTFVCICTNNIRLQSHLQRSLSFQEVTLQPEILVTIVS